MNHSDKTAIQDAQTLAKTVDQTEKPGQNNSVPVIEVGKVVGVWGIKGWIKLHSYTRERVGIAKYKSWILRPDQKNGVAKQFSVEIDICREQGKGVVAKIAGLEDRNIAETYIGHKIFIESSQLPKLPKGEYYWSQLIGLDVVNVQGQSFGTVDSMMETGANDVFVVVESIVDDAGETQKVEHLIPQVDQVVVEVNEKDNLLTVEWYKD